MSANAKSMNGINNIEINEVQFPDGSTISSANNLVQLDTNNNFTSFNTYNTNLPTSDVNPDLVNINNNTILNRHAADKLYTGSDTNDFITGFSRNGTTGVITLTQEDTGTPITTETYTSITDAQLTAIDNAVLKTTAQEIDGVKTFVDFPEIKKVGQVVPNPIDDEQFATKKYVDDNAGGGSGDALLAGGTEANNQEFTGFNTFTKDLTIEGGASSATRADLVMLGSYGYMLQSATTQNKIRQNGATNDIDQNGTNNTISQSGVNSVISTSGKMTCSTAPSGGSDLCNKTYVDGLNKTAFGQNFSANPIIGYVVTGGNPTAASGGDNLNGRMDTPVSGLNADIDIPVITGALGEVGKVKIDYNVIGEWNSVEWDKGLILARAEKQADGSFPYTILFRAYTDTSYPATGRCLSPFIMMYQSDQSSTMEQAIGFFIDDTAVAGKTYRYTPVLVNFSSITGTFYLNRVISNVNGIFYERAVSCITATILNV